MTIDKVSLQCLPAEILEKIGDYCAQSDAFHLCLTCRYLYYAVVKRLYQCIIFDSTHRHFNREVNRWRASRDREDSSEQDLLPCTSVRTVGGLRECLRALRADGGRRASLVKRIECHNSLEIPDLEIRKAFQEIFAHATNLRSIVWSASPEIGVDMLMKVYNSHNITALSLDMAIRMKDKFSHSIGDLNMPNLGHLILRPYVSNSILRQIAQMVVKSAPPLKTLYLGKQLQSGHQTGSGFAFAAMGVREHEEEALGGGPMGAFFGTLRDNNVYLDQLERLGLEGVTVTSSDWSVLCDCVSTGNLTHLSLNGMELRRPNEKSFLTRLAPHLTSVRHLRIDWHEQGYSAQSFPAFIRALDKLQSLDVVPGRDNLIAMHHLESIGQAIVRHAKTLKHLSLLPEGTVSSAYYQLVIGACTGLVGLRMPLNQQSIAWMSSLKQLTYLHLVRFHREPYLGQRLSTSYILEDTERLHYRVEALCRVAPALRYIRLEDYLFAYQPAKHKPASLRDGLVQWFDSNIMPEWSV